MSLGSLISLGGVGVLTGHIVDSIFDFCYDLCLFPIIECGIKTIVSLIKTALSGVAYAAFIGPVIGCIGNVLASIIHELPGIIYDCGLGNCYGIMEIICGIGNLLCCIPTGCLTISSIPFCFSPLFYPFGCIAVFLSSLISFLVTCITPIMGTLGGCCRTMFCAIGGDIFSDVIGDYITDMCLTPLFKLIIGEIIALITTLLESAGIIGSIAAGLGIPVALVGFVFGIIVTAISDMVVGCVMGIIEIPFEFCGEVIDMIAETSSIGLSTMEVLFGYGICCLCPTIILPCYVLQCIVNFICCCCPI